MLYVIIGLVVIFAVWWFLNQPGNLSFWKLASRYPNQAYDWFVEEDCWIVLDPHDSSARPREPQSDYTGPFLLSIPKLGGRMIRIYGRFDEIADSQDRFSQWIQSLPYS